MGNKKPVKNTKVIFERGAWYYRSKSLNEDFTVKYIKKGGFKSAKDAITAQSIADVAFEEQLHCSGSPAHDTTLFQYLLSFLYQYYSQTIESSTLSVYDYVLNQLIIPHGRDISLRLVSTEYVNALLETVHPYGTSAAPKVREFLHVAFENAVQNGLVHSNVVKASRKYSRETKPKTILSKVQLKQLLSAAYADTIYFECLCALFMGLRKGEILGLKFEDFDIENQLVYIQRQATMSYTYENGKKVAGEMTIKEPKTKNGYRSIPVPSIILEELKFAIRRVDSIKKLSNTKYTDNRLVFCTKDGEIHGGAFFNIALNRVCTSCAIPMITPHTLRHMYGTILLEQGEPIENVSVLMGHKSVHTTFEIYANVMCAKKEPMNAIDISFGENVSLLGSEVAT